jgi:hypothetical protein
MPPNSSGWLAECIGGETGKPLPILANVLIGLRAEMVDAFAYDEMLRAPLLMRPLERTNGGFTPRPLTDVDIGVVQERLQHLGLKRVARDTVHQAVDMRAQECRFHPVYDYLEALEWGWRSEGGEIVLRILRRHFGSPGE